MRIETNEKLVRRNTRIANYLFFFTFAVLIGAFFITNGLLIQNTASIVTVLAPPLVLILGFGATFFSVRMTNLWIRQPRPEKALSDGLKGLSNKSILYNYYHMPARHVLICPQGVFAIHTPWQGGKHSANGAKWHTHRSLAGQLLSLLRFDSTGNPMETAYRASENLKKQLDPIAPDIEVKPLVVFLDSNAQLTLEDPIVPVVFADDKTKPCLKDYMRELSREAEDEADNKKRRKKDSAPLPLTQEQIDAFEAASLR